MFSSFYHEVRETLRAFFDTLKLFKFPNYLEIFFKYIYPKYILNQMYTLAIGRKPYSLRLHGFNRTTVHNPNPKGRFSHV